LRIKKNKRKGIAILMLSSGYCVRLDADYEGVCCIQYGHIRERDVCISILNKMYNELKEYLPSKDVVEKEANEYRRTNGQASNT
jgi:hypothetical protein